MYCCSCATLALSHVPTTKKKNHHLSHPKSRTVISSQIAYEFNQHRWPNVHIKSKIHYANSNSKTSAIPSPTFLIFKSFAPCAMIYATSPSFLQHHLFNTPPPILIAASFAGPTVYPDVDVPFVEPAWNVWGRDVAGERSVEYGVSGDGA